MNIPKLSNSGEPVMIVSTGTAVVGWVGTFLVTHGVITATEASTGVQTIGPAVVGAVALFGGVLIRRYVSPAVKAVEAKAAALGVDLTGEPEVTGLLASLGLDPDGDPVTDLVPEQPAPDPLT